MRYERFLKNKIKELLIVDVKWIPVSGHSLQKIVGPTTSVRRESEITHVLSGP